MGHGRTLGNDVEAASVPPAIKKLHDLRSARNARQVDQQVV